MQTSSLTFIVAFVIVLALIGLVAYLVRRFGGSRLGANANRGRMPRLAVIDAAAVDGRRRLVLVRRDNVEHLLMIGGPTDIVVEPNIVRASPRGEPMTPRASVGGDLPPRPAPLPDAAGWTDAETRADAFEPIEPPIAEPAPRARPTFADEVRRPAPPALGERPSSLMPSPMIRPEPAVDTPPLPRPPRSEPAMPRPSRLAEPSPRMPPPVRNAAPPPPVAPSAPAAPSNAEQNLAEMAQRLEAALRRPSGEQQAAAPAVAPEPSARPSAAPRSEASMAPPITPSPKTGFENLEDEMASLLGRPKTPT